MEAFPDALVGLPSVTSSRSLLPMLGKRRLVRGKVVERRRDGRGERR